MLQLKKQQLQMEIQKIAGAIAKIRREEERERHGLMQWVELFSEPVAIDEFVTLAGVALEEGNIAGVTIPVLKETTILRHEYDLFAVPTWVDDAVDVLDNLIRLRIERETLDEQRRLIREELRITTQRVNLFEKVKIPECRENIRVIKIFLGEEQTAAVVRGKLAKRLTQAA
jgi:V/A-type H+-transporting ATPase subunit D